MYTIDGAQRPAWIRDKQHCAFAGVVTLQPKRGGGGIPVQVDHTVAGAVEALANRIPREVGGLDLLVNDVWGGDELTAWGKPLWEHSLDDGLLVDTTTRALAKAAA